MQSVVTKEESTKTLKINPGSSGSDEAKKTMEEIRERG